MKNNFEKMKEILQEFGINIDVEFMRESKEYAKDSYIHLNVVEKAQGNHIKEYIDSISDYRGGFMIDEFDVFGEKVSLKKMWGEAPEWFSGTILLKCDHKEEMFVLVPWREQLETYLRQQISDGEVDFFDRFAEDAPAQKMKEAFIAEAAVQNLNDNLVKAQKKIAQETEGNKKLKKMYCEFIELLKEEF